MTAKTHGMNAAEKYAAEIDVPIYLIRGSEKLIRAMLRNAFQAGMTAGIRVATNLIKEHQK